jgi:hypothetical protein
VTLVSGCTLKGIDGKESGCVPKNTNRLVVPSKELQAKEKFQAQELEHDK